MGHSRGRLSPTLVRIVLVCMVLAATFARAQAPDTAGQDNLPARLAACRAISDSLQRLRCYDEIAETPEQNNTWRSLIIAPESRCSPYDPDDYRYPQSVEDRITAQLGGVYGPYTGRWFATQRETDIEHIVARSEAHDSGLCAVDNETRRRFASDLLNLTLASPSVNRNQKSDRDAAEWLPDQNQCWFVDRVVAVRQKYRLTIDRREADAIDAVLGSCESTAMIVSDRRAALTPPAPLPNARSQTKCGPYRNCTELRRDHPNGVSRGHCAYQRRMDRDNDGRACER